MVNASHVYVRALALGCFYSHIRRALTASLDSCAEIDEECPFSGVTKSGRVWRKVPESDARSVRLVMHRLLRHTPPCTKQNTHSPSITFRHLPHNSVKTGYATEGALFIFAQLSIDAVSAFRKVWVLIRSKHIKDSKERLFIMT